MVLDHLRTYDVKWGIRNFFLHCKNGRALVLPVDMRRKGADGLGQFWPALFACKALPFVSCKEKMPMPHSERHTTCQNERLSKIEDQIKIVKKHWQ